MWFIMPGRWEVRALRLMKAEQVIDLYVLRWIRNRLVGHLVLLRFSLNIFSTCSVLLWGGGGGVSLITGDYQMAVTAGYSTVIGDELIWSCSISLARKTKSIPQDLKADSLVHAYPYTQIGASLPSQKNA